MSREYVERRIREALKLHKNNATRARQQIIAWTQEDVRLLHGLTRPHMTGIVAHALNRVILRSDRDDVQEIPDLPQGLNMGAQTFGQEILKALSGSSAVFGHEENNAAPSRRQASKRHIDAMNMIARKKIVRDE